MGKVFHRDRLGISNAKAEMLENGTNVGLVKDLEVGERVLK